MVVMISFLDQLIGHILDLTKEEKVKKILLNVLFHRNICCCVCLYVHVCVYVCACEHVCIHACTHAHASAPVENQGQP